MLTRLPLEHPAQVFPGSQSWYEYCFADKSISRLPASVTSSMATSNHTRLT